MLVFYPGLINADTLRMWANARDGGAAEDWHSPFLVFVFRLLQHADLNIAVVTLAQSALYVLTLHFLLGRACITGPRRIAVLAAVLAVPPTLTWLAAVEKTTIASCLLCACFGLAVAMERADAARKIHFGLMLLAALAGAWTRPNGILLFAPIVIYATARAWWPSRRWMAGAIVAAYVVLWAAVPAIATSAGLIVPTHPEQATMALDLLNISFEKNKDLLPPGVLTAPLSVVEPGMLAQPLPPYDGRFSTLALRRAHMLNFDGDPAHAAALHAAWLRTILHYPLAYLRFRLAMFRAFNCFDSRIVCYDSWHWYTGGVDTPNSAGIVSHHVAVLFNLYKSLAGTIFYRPYFHAALMLGLLAIALWRRQHLIAVTAATLLLYYASGLILLPGISVRMIVPLGLMEPPLVIALITQSYRRRKVVLF
ncbi:MAG TPA: hypothetical protein VMB71_15650 [Acetobacteraceae bacterium]|nr:hypothetical protein [Acetobacteraceae bacterium]